jgi:hypothetical protein
LFTLHFPLQLPAEHAFFDNGQYPIPPLPGGLSIRCISNDDTPLVLHISGFASEQEAVNYGPILRGLLRGASLDSAHSMTPSSADTVVSQAKHFDGSVPTVTPTALSAMPYHATMSMQNGLHISVLSRALSDCLARNLPAKLIAKPELSLSLELFSDFEFSGGTNAQFVMLLTALEVLVPSGTKSKRGPAIALVKVALAAAGHPDPKSVGKRLDALYIARNSLVHEAKPVSIAQLAELKEIVRRTLKALTA